MKPQNYSAVVQLQPVDTAGLPHCHSWTRVRGAIDWLFPRITLHFLNRDGSIGCYVAYHWRPSLAWVSAKRV